MTPTPPTWLLPFALARTTARRALRADLLSAYFVSVTKVASWAVAAGLVYRNFGKETFAAFALARSLITIVNYTSFGVAPALMILLPQFRVQQAPVVPEVSTTHLGYERPGRRPEATPTTKLFSTAMAVSCLPFLLVAAALWLFDLIRQSHLQYEYFWTEFSRFIFAFSIGACFRVVADVAGARLQSDGRITLDNTVQGLVELTWLLCVIKALPLHGISTAGGAVSHDAISSVNGLWIATGAAMALIRWLLARSGDGNFVLLRWNSKYAGLLLATGSTILAAQIADLFYAPANLWLIKHFLTAEHLATYAPTLHIDAALLLLVSGLSAILLPKTAIALAAKDHVAIRRYYLHGTLASVILLAGAAGLFCLFSGRLFQLWFADPMPATQVILPLVMIHTVVGGASSIGRSVLLGIGRVKAYAIAALVGGIANVILAVILVTQTSLGLKGIIYATILTVTLRCAIWMPWYTMRAIRSASVT
jgi:O-antigen/teichoic acid export membrane protein